jgi:hypothetical protein
MLCYNENIFVGITMFFKLGKISKCILDTCSQEGQHDEYNNCYDTTTLETLDSKVKPFLIMIVFDTFDELMFRHDVCSLSFLEIHTWIKRSIKHSWKAWRTKEVDWGHIPCIPNVLHQATMTLWPKERKRLNLTRFGRAGFGLQESVNF